jgi:hypothetical protein
MENEPSSKKIGKRLLLIGAILIAIGFMVGLLTRDILSSTTVIAIPLGVISLFAGFILIFVRIKKVETTIDTRSTSYKIMLGLPGFLAGLFIGYLLLFVLSNIIFLAALGVILFISIYIVFRRGTKPVNNVHITFGGFVLGYVIVYAMNLCLAPFIMME